MELTEQQMMLLDIDGVLTQHKATPTDVLTAAQALAVSAIGDLVNKNLSSITGGAGGGSALHRLADLAADQLRAAMHMRIGAGPQPDW